MNSSKFFEFYIDNTHSQEALDTIWNNLIKEKIAGVSLGTTGGTKTKLASAVRNAKKNIDITNVYTAVSVDLADIYNDKKKNVNRVFIISIIAIALGMLLLLIGVSLSFWGKDSGQIKIITGASGIITTFLSGTFFWFYKRENAKLADIENDIRKIKVLEGFAAIASNMQNDEVITTAYQKIVKQMDL